jgi:XTP/dITP diphosphohydrolase
VSRELVCASANPDKVAEIAALLEAAGVVLLPRPPGIPDVVEDGETLEANARLKASAIAAATGRPAVADDTGLEVDALGGRPGVHTGRFALDEVGAGPGAGSGVGALYAANVAKLLRLLAEAGAATPAQRRASFRTVALVRDPHEREVSAEGVVEGWISDAPRGRGGFGYDPVFVPFDGDGRTFAEMSSDEKHRLSHRGRAFRALAERLATDRSTPLGPAGDTATG